MRKTVFLLLFLFLGLFFTGCSMVPADEDIINGSVMESEIFDDEELSMNDEKGIEGEEGEEQDILGDEEIIQDDEELSGDVDIEVVD